MSVDQTNQESKFVKYLKKRFTRKFAISRGIIAAAALVLVLALSLSFYLWLKDAEPGIVGKENGFLYLDVTWNEGIGFGALKNKPSAIYAIQSIVFILLVAAYFFLCDDYITASFVALAMFGGLFNMIQRGASGSDKVLDYFHFGSWIKFDFVFNWPDVFVVIGIFGFVISYITITIIHAVRENREKKEQMEEPIKVPEPTVPVATPTEKVQQ